MKKYINLSLTFSIGVLLIGFLQCQPQPQAEEDNIQSPFEHIKKPVVSTMELKPQPFNHFFEVQGRVKAEKDVLLVPEVGGRITALPVREGQKIKRGELVARFDNSVVNASRAELETQLENAQFLYEKQKRLFEKGVGTEVALKAAETRLHTLEKSIERIGKQTKKFALYAPFSGYVERVYPVQGQIAGPPSPVIHLINLKNLSAKASISEVYLKDLREGALAELYFPAIDLTMKDLKINRVGRIVDPTNRTIDVEVDIPSPPSNVLPNLMVVLRVNDYHNPAALTVPSRTVLKDFKDRSFVFVISEDGRVKKKYIELGKQYDHYIEVTSGLDEGDQLILRGARSVAEGDSVEVRNNNL